MPRVENVTVAKNIPKGHKKKKHACKAPQKVRGKERDTGPEFCKQFFAKREN